MENTNLNNACTAIEEVRKEYIEKYCKASNEPYDPILMAIREALTALYKAEQKIKGTMQ
jgi:hypothetical protein